MWPDPAEGIRERLDDLLKEVKKPHWSVTPSFWLLVASVIISIIALILAFLGLPQVQKSEKQQSLVSKSQNSQATKVDLLKAPEKSP